MLIFIRNQQFSGPTLFYPWGSGTLKIINSCREAGLPEPEIKEMNGGVSITLFAHNLSNETGKMKNDASVKTPVETRVKTPSAILAELRENNSLTLTEIAERIGKSVSAVERAAKKLGEQGKLKYVGPQKGGHWKVMDD